MGPDATPDSRRVRMRYERASGRYAQRALIEAELAGRLVERTQHMNLDPAMILDGGCGPGSALGALRARFPRARLVGVDFARGMLRAARGAPDGTALAGAELERLPFAGGMFDVCWLNACLHLVPDRAAVLREAHRVLADGGLFIFSTFGPDTLKELRAAFGGIDSCAHAGRFSDMHDLGDELRSHRLVDPVMEADELVLLYSRPEDLVEELRSSGAANVARGARRRLMGRGAWNRFLQNYRDCALRPDGKVAATFEVILGHAWCTKSVPRADSPGLSPVDFYRKN